MMKKFLYLVTLAVLAFIITHVIEILLIPYFAKNYLWNSLKNEAPESVFFKLPATNPIMKTNDPAFKVIACRFNLKNLPLHIKAKSENVFWTMAIFNDKAERFFSINKSVNTLSNIDYILTSPIQLADLKQLKIKGDNNIIISPSDEGFILLRIANLNNRWEAEVADFINSAECSHLLPQIDKQPIQESKKQPEKPQKSSKKKKKQ